MLNQTSSPPPAPKPHFRWRLLFFTLLCLTLLGYAASHQLLPPWLTPHRQLTWQPANWWSSETPTAGVSADAILQAIQNQRAPADLAPVHANTTLEKTARLATLEIEDSQDIQMQPDYQTLLNAVSLTTPPEVESLTFFLTGLGEIASVLNESQAQLLTDANFTQVGIATRSATIDNQSGIIVVILASPDFREEPAQDANTPTTRNQVASPSYTGQDLWTAVQNYRRAHQLSPFEQSNELCTVASIRLNEQLELGKLDNHDGFDQRAEDFFQKNPGWTSLNENLASGYDTAVQTVEWGWDQSLGHQALIKSQDYPYACAAANAGFAVLITGK